MKKVFLFSAVLLLIGFFPLVYAENEEDKLVILHTESGDLVIEFFPNDAPNHVENFITLVEEGFYDRTVFHRVIKDFMIQGGDPKTKPGGYETVLEWGTGDPGYSINAEFNSIKHNRGIVSMARAADPNSAGSQFFIVHENSNFLDEQYTVFGRIVTQESFETLDKIANLETAQGGDVPLKWGDAEILSAKVVDRNSIENILDLGEPERITQSTIPPEAEGPYTNERLGITFDAPEGWLIQEPEKLDPSTPDLVMVGPQINGFNPAIAITVDLRNDRSLDEKILQSNANIQDAIDAGQLEIISEEKTTINGINSYLKNAKGIFVLSGNPTNIIFREAILASQDNFYTITYSNEENNFNENLGRFNDVVYSFSADSENTNLTNEEGGGCLIATAAYGSELAPQVQFLREVRDNTLLSTESGTSFMAGFNDIYYSFSPAVADLERESPVFREAVKLFITPMLSTLSIMTLAEEGSESSVLGLGISVIALNLGMYIAAPAIIINRLRK